MRSTSTPEEKAWWAKFKRLSAQMPPTMEVLCGATGIFQAAERGALDREFAAKGDADNVPTLINLSPIHTTGFKDNSSSL
jgi:hypothetical protein